nr:zinc finger protein ZFAT isoform X1 [Nothobranchius furzeri]
MDGEQTAGSVFMCRLCNLFSPSRSQLLAHCSQLHPQQTSPEKIIIALQPLPAEAAEKLPENPVKRKRGRPKGSVKKNRVNLTEGTAATAHSEVKGDLDAISLEDENLDGLECQRCHRSFGNRRQILKHICLREESDFIENGSVCSGGDLDSNGVNLSHVQNDSTRPEKDMDSFNCSRGNRSQVFNKGGPMASQKKTVISVILAEDKKLPAGVCKIVPVENELASADPAQHQNSGNGDPACEKDTTDQEPSSNLNPTAAATTKGFQEYSIKQNSTSSFPQSQLKVFACEFCQKIFKFRHSLVAHLRTHTQEKPFQCPHCDYASAIKANLIVHLRKHTGEKFSCEHCPFSCLSPGHLKVHVERVHLKIKQPCSFCEKKYADVKNLLKHMEKQHNLSNSAVNQNYQQLRLKTRQGLRQLLYHCSTCNRRFKNQLERERHMLVHLPQPPFACMLCDHAATKMAALAAHVRKHLFLYICCVCDTNLVSSLRLRSHLGQSHPELDLEQTFIDCINISYCLGPPEKGGGGSEQAQEMEENMDGDGGGRDGDGSVKIDKGSEQKEEIRNEGAERRFEDRRGQTPSDEKLNETTESFAAAEILKGNTQMSLSAAGSEIPPQENTHTPSPGKARSDINRDTPSSSGPLGENAQTPNSEKSAFQQVLSSLQKTPLDMETFQRLRKVYGNLECHYCGRLFWYKVHFNIHVRTHTKEHLYHCLTCSYSSVTKSSLKRHQIQKHSDLLLPCSAPGCKFTTADKYKLQAHARTHQDQRSRVTCPVCHGSYLEHRLKQHMKTSHPDKVPVGKGAMVQRTEKCPHCDSYFLKNSSDFQQHIWAHQGLKPFVCSVCDYSSRSRSNLKAHMNRHNMEKHHLCDLCGKKFKSKFTLKSHRLSHTEEGKRFQCSECHFTSVFKPLLLRHMEQHAKFKPFRCTHCHYSCNFAGALKRHYNMKHPDEMYENAGPGLPNADALKQQGGRKCPECEFVYGTKWELNRHLKTRHNQKAVQGTWEVAVETEAQYVTVENEEQLTEATVAVLEDNVNTQQISELSSETQDAVASMVAMAPGTVTVVQQLQVAEEQEVGECSDQLMVVNTEESLDGNQLMVVEDAGGLEALTVLTQGEDTHHYIVYIQEQTVEIN